MCTGNKKLLKFMARICFKHFGSESKTARYAGWLYFRVVIVQLHISK